MTTKPPTAPETASEKVSQEAPPPYTPDRDQPALSRSQRLLARFSKRKSHPPPPPPDVEEQYTVSPNTHLTQDQADDINRYLKMWTRRAGDDIWRYEWKANSDIRSSKDQADLEIRSYKIKADYQIARLEMDTSLKTQKLESNIRRKKDELKDKIRHMTDENDDKRGLDSAELRREVACRKKQQDDFDKDTGKLAITAAENGQSVFEILRMLDKVYKDRRNSLYP